MGFIRKSWEDLCLDAGYRLRYKSNVFRENEKKDWFGVTYFEDVYGDHQVTIDKTTPDPTISLGKLLTWNFDVPIKQDRGHHFWSEKHSVTKPPWISVPGKGWGDFEGYVWPDMQAKYAAWRLGDRVGQLGAADDHAISMPELLQYGAEGIKRATQTVPHIDAFTILGELHEGLPKVPGSSLWSGVFTATQMDGILVRGFLTNAEKTKLFSSVGKASADEFLNFIFGVQPLLKDLGSVMFLNNMSPDDMLKRVQGKLMKNSHRTVTLVAETKPTTEVRTMWQNTTLPFWSTGFGTLTSETVFDRHVWFEGVFDHSAWYNPLKEKLGRLYDYLSSYGALPTASGVWQLLPYSWLTDWFLDVGLMLDNVRHFQEAGLTMPYGYVMAKTITDRRWLWEGPVGNYIHWIGGAGLVDVRSDVHALTTVKQRVRASPFGFGFAMHNLNDMQKAILAALGLSRLKLFPL